MYVEGLIPNFKPCLVMKINGIQVPTTKRGLQSGFGRVKFENPTPQTVLQIQYIGKERQPKWSCDLFNITTDHLDPPLSQ
jgi:hypothetical protein